MGQNEHGRRSSAEEYYVLNGESMAGKSARELVCYEGFLVSDSFWVEGHRLDSIGGLRRHSSQCT